MDGLDGDRGRVGPLLGGWLIDAGSWRWIFAINVPFVLATLVLVAVAIPPPEAGARRRRIDWTGAALCAIGLAGPVYGLIRQPEAGWASAEVLGPILGGVAVLAAFLWHERRAADPMLPLGLFARRNFAVGNLQTLAMYGGLSITFFFLVLYLQQVAGYDALQAGAATLPTTLVMFALSKRFGALADRIGPRALMGGGPLLAAAGLAWFMRMPAAVDYAVDVLPGLLVFSLGLAMTVAPLTMTVLADADEHNAGIASGINNAVARVAGLLAIAALGAVVAATFASSLDGALGERPLSPAAQRVVDRRASARWRGPTREVWRGRGARRGAAPSRTPPCDAFRTGIGIAAALVALGGVLGLAGIVNPRRTVSAAGCAGGQLVGAPEEVALPRAAAVPT